MRLNKKILKSRCKQPLPQVKFLNLSGLNLDIIEHLGHCENLHWLIASENELQADEGITRLKQLWYLDLSNNQIQTLNCLSRFLALGTLVLSNNNIKWSDLERLSHAHIMSLSLNGNPQLDSDPYYRIHVIDCLPLIWELDGRLVTVTERLHVRQFFIDTQYTDHPVRHKTCKTFQTTSLKNIGTEGIVSKECKYIFSKFPMSEKHTKHTDERRLKYLANMVQEDILQMLDEKDIKVALKSNFLNELLLERYKDVERCNMVLLLLVGWLEAFTRNVCQKPLALIRTSGRHLEISLEFQLPTSLVKATLISAQLDMIGKVNTMSFFLLPREHRTKVVSILLNAAKVDRDNNVKHEGGLYPQLFMCLYYTVAQLNRIRQTSPKNMHKVKPISHNSDYIALMASEAASLMLRNIKFFNYFTTEYGVMALVTAATGSIKVVLSVKDRLTEMEINDTVQEEYKLITNHILEAIELRLNEINIKMADIPIGDRYLSLSDSLPIKPLHSVIWASNYLSNGQQVPRTDPPILHPEREALKPKPLQAKMGEKVLLGPQVVGELTMLMEGDIAMARIDQVPVANGAVVSKLKSSDAHFTFVDMKSLCYAKDIGMWRPIRTTGDKYSIHSMDAKASSGCDRDKPKSARTEDGYSTPLIYTPKDQPQGQMKTPPSTADKVRPKSSMAPRSLSQVMVRRVMSADVNNSNNNAMQSASMKDFKQSLMSNEFNELFPTASTPQPRPKTASSLSKTRVGSGLSCSSLHQNDNVHYIHGFTPREDSSRSGSMSVLTTPVTSDRQQIMMISEGTQSPDAKTVLLEDFSEQKHDESEKQPLPSSTEIDSDRERSNQISNEQVKSEEASEQQLEKGENESTNHGGGEEFQQEEHSHIDLNNYDSTVAGDELIGKGGFRDNCPICIAVADGSLKRMGHLQAEVVPPEQSSPVEIPQVEKEVVDVKEPINDKEGALSTSEKDGNIPISDRDVKLPTNERNVKPSSNENDAKIKISDKDVILTADDNNKNVENAENIAPVSEALYNVVVPPTSALKISTGYSEMPKSDRPKSAVESYNYYVIHQPQGVFATGTSAKMNERNTSNGFKTDFQQQREEAWRRTTRNRKQRPLTATIMTTTKLPPPQRPSTPSFSQIRNRKLYITRTDRWLGGGRDLYWESVHKRPKSGHTPGWKEGLPESMRKKRPVSAYVMSSTALKPYTGRSVTPSIRSHEYSSYNGNRLGESTMEESMFFITQSHPLQPMPEPQSRQLTTPESEDDHRNILQIQGIPPPSIPNPCKRHSFRRNLSSPFYLDFILEDEEPGCGGRPSSQLSFNDDNGIETISPRLLTPGANYNDYTIPMTPVIYYIVQNKFDTTYELCPFHKKMVFPYYAGPVIYD